MINIYKLFNLARPARVYKYFMRARRKTGDEGTTGVDLKFKVTSQAQRGQATRDGGAQRGDSFCISGIETSNKVRGDTERDIFQFCKFNNFTLATLPLLDTCFLNSFYSEPFFPTLRYNRRM